MLPKEWHRSTLGEIARITSGGTPDRSKPEYWDGDIPWVTTGEIQFNTITDTDEKITAAGLQNSSAKLFPPGTLLMAMYGQGKTRGQVAKLGIEAATNQNSAAILLNDGHAPDFYFHFLSSQYENIRDFGHSGGVSHLNAGLLKQIAVPVAPIREQHRVAQILSTWDQAIVAAEQVVANSLRQRLGLTQALISDRSRQARGMPTLPREHASAIFLPRSMRRNEGLELLSVMQDVGVVPRSSLDRKVVMPEGSTDGYKLVEPGDFVISLRSFEGGLEYSRFRGLVSPAYTVLQPAKPIVDDFYRHYFKSREFIGRLAVAVIGIRDGKQISYDDFEFLKLPYPPIAEQEAIAKTLNAAEQVVKQHETYLQLLRQEKAALMSQLLTGKRRVKLQDIETEVQA
ncbi:TPA: restriction endonuclease subunit S [Stenotrophomonas maltophilia]|nr:restriction endonuclease subunit S [Stenotrophomonas pavanii]HEL3179794.1 restriction endonuclease subunit S [Stenotrophomonas maltophilia]